MVWALSSKQNSIDVLQKDKRATGVKIQIVFTENKNFSAIFELKDLRNKANRYLTDDTFLRFHVRHKLETAVNYLIHICDMLCPCRLASGGT